GRACSVRRRSFNRRPSFAGIVRVSRRSGVGNRGSGQGGQRSIESCAICRRVFSMAITAWAAKLTLPAFLKQPPDLADLGPHGFILLQQRRRQLELGLTTSAQSNCWGEPH